MSYSLLDQSLFVCVPLGLVAVIVGLVWIAITTRREYDEEVEKWAEHQIGM